MDSGKHKGVEKRILFVQPWVFCQQITGIMCWLCYTQVSNEQDEYVLQKKIEIEFK